MDESAISHLKKIISNRLTLGVVVLEESGEIMYLNDEARSILLTLIPEKITASNDSSRLNNAIIELFKESLGSLTAPRSTCIFSPDKNNAYSLRALPLQKPLEKGKSCIMILIEGIAIQHKFNLKEVQKRFSLTRRETEVTFCLTRGMTNKEIANALSLSPETVHGYIKQIMKKLRTTTRAGIVGKVMP
jgi:DNA-binding CsgD family transcriptional regulator